MFYDPGQFADLATETLTFDYAIFVQIDTHNADRSKVAGFTITASDLARHKQAAAADMQAMLQELERVHAERQNPLRRHRCRLERYDGKVLSRPLPELKHSAVGSSTLTRR